MRLGRDGIAGLIVLAVSLVLLVMSFDLPQLPIVPVGPGFYPRIVLSFMAATSVLLVAQDFVAQRARAAGGKQAAGVVIVPWRVTAAFAVIAAYIFLLPVLGFRLSTPLFVAALQATLELPRTRRQWAVLAAVAAGTAAVTYLAFETYLLVLLPRGTLTGW